MRLTRDSLIFDQKLKIAATSVRQYFFIKLVVCGMVISAEYKIQLLINLSK